MAKTTRIVAKLKVSALPHQQNLSSLKQSSVGIEQIYNYYYSTDNVKHSQRMDFNCYVSRVCKTLNQKQNDQSCP